LLNQRYIFDSFVMGPNNRFAHMASLAVAEAPAKTYNPLYIYGRTGLGKTHLMHAIGNSVKETNSNLKILYISSEEFTNAMIESLRHGTPMPEFRSKYRTVDVLLIDDVQFIRGKDGTQEEFFHTFNALYNAQKQIVLTSDRHPRDIVGLEERLRARFEWGLVTVLEPPELDTRIAILRKKNEQLGKTRLPDDVVMFIAKHVTTNIGQLEGCLIKAWGHADLDNAPLSIDLAQEALKDVIPQDSGEQDLEKKHESKDVMPETMKESIGNVAGEIWIFLDAQSQATELSILEKALQLPHKLLVMGLGWLAREDKLNIEIVNGSYMVSVKCYDVPD